MASLKHQLLDLLASCEGLEARPSPVAGGTALFYRGREFAHFHHDQELDLRLTSRLIRSLGLSHPAGSRFHPSRSASSPWIELRFNTPAEVQQVAECVRLAMAQLPATEPSAEPPTAARRTPVAENKTKATAADVDAHLEAIDNETVRADCQALARLMASWTGEAPTMWGPSIIGFGSYHYRYESGREGDSCATGFAARKNEIAIYLVAEGVGQAELLARLGRHRMGKACLYIRRLSEIDTAVLERLVKGSLADVRRRYGPGE
jgi:Family of unknown function (DUF5519)/Domain of unknown function (DU1801)